jgi:hypothetical protein
VDSTIAVDNQHSRLPESPSERLGIKTEIHIACGVQDSPWGICAEGNTLRPPGY